MRSRLVSALAVFVLVMAGLVSCTGAKVKKVDAPPDAGIAPSLDAGLPEEIDAGEPDAAADVPDAGEPHDAGLPVDAGSAPDAGHPDAGMPVDAGPMCPPPPTFNYQCNASDPSTCPMGFCILGQCIAPQVNQDQWDSCGNGKCDPCETATSCPADCGQPPPMSGTKVYNNDTTITVFVHGFSNVNLSKFQNQVYGDVRGCGDIGDAAQEFGIDRPCGDTAAGAMAPNQIVGVEYYGALPPSWMTPQDVADVEQYPFRGGPTGLQRYGRIVAKFIKWRMATTGATHVNIACHSMGCLISRYLIENNLENLAAENKIVRWSTSGGVVCGARLARLYDNPSIRMAADSIGLQVDDFALMNPDYVREYAASWDHQLYQGNNPLFAGMLIHHMGATDPHIGQALNIQLLDLDNPGDEPNDGIMFTLDEFFHSQSPAASLTTPSGEVISATHTFAYEQHTSCTSSEEYHVVAAAGLFHSRKAFLSLDSITLKKDREFDLIKAPTEQGVPPGEVVIQSTVKYHVPGIANPVLVQDDQITYRSPDLFEQMASTTLMPHQVFFAAPVFDDQTSLHLKAEITEADLYPRWKINEALIDPNRELVTFDGDITLQDQVVHVENDYAAADLRVHVVQLY